MAAPTVSAEGEAGTTTEPADGADADHANGRSGLLLLALAGLLALVPARRVVGIIGDGSELQHTDYWMMLDRFLTDDGGYRLAALFEFQNHPVVVPQLILWANIELFDGSNITLGYVVVGIVAVQLAIVAVALRRTPLHGLVQGAVLLTGSLLLFGLGGLWNFTRAMSGTAWLTANTFALSAIVLRSRDRTIWAFALCALAAISYSTGAISWIAVAAVGALHRPWRQWWRELPLAAGLLATWLWYQANGISSDPPVTPSFSELLDVASRLFGRAVGLTGQPARAASVVLVAGSAGLTVWLARRARVRGARAFAGIACFGILTTFQIAYGRFDLLAIYGEQSRYHSLSALAWLGFAGLAALGAQSLGTSSGPEPHRRPGLVGLLGRPLAGVALLAPLAIGAATTGDDPADDLAVLDAEQTLREIALRLDLADDTFVLVPAVVTPDPLSVTDRLRTIGHYPFVEGWDLDCGLLGETLPSADPAPDGVGELTAGRVNPVLPMAVELTGRVDPALDPRCLVITGGEEASVIGIGAMGVPPLDEDGSPEVDDDDDGFTFRALAESFQPPYQAHVVLRDGSVLTLAGEIWVRDIETAL